MDKKIFGILICYFFTFSLIQPRIIFQKKNRDMYQTKNKNNDLNCINRGSLNNIAIDMLNFSSPLGSLSRKKLKHVLDQNHFFYIDLGPAIFSSIQESLSLAFTGYGIQRCFQKPTINQTNITLIETIFTKSSCPFALDNCQTHTRIILQSEQYQSEHFIKSSLSQCHLSPNCIIFEFSDHNYHYAKEEKKWGDSIVLLPIMHQSPSRLSKSESKLQLVEKLKPLSERIYDIVFFGSMTKRRKFLFEESESYKVSHPNSSILVMYKTSPRDMSFMADAYKNTKVCLIVHSYSNIAGGEYHRLTEFAEFGCIPVMEEFSDKFGINQYRRCAYSFFAQKDHLFKTAEYVISLVNNGDFDDFSHVKWWKNGIEWRSIFLNLK